MSLAKELSQRIDSLVENDEKQLSKKRPPKGWFDDTVAALKKEGKVDDPEKMASWLWFHHMHDPEKRKEAEKTRAPEESFVELPEDVLDELQFMQELVEAELDRINLDEYIRKEGGKFVVHSHQTGKVFGRYDTEAQAKHRLQQMHAFSH